MKKTTSFVLFSFFFTVFVFSQRSDTDLKEVFLSAESYFLFEEYNEALPLYLKLNKAYPDNDNYNFKIGVCYLNNPFEKSKSIYYLEKAIKNINLKYKDNSIKESKAPLESLFYLGNAYRINNQLDKAREFYNKFLKQLDPLVYDIELVKEQLTACDVAENLMRKPVDFDAVNLKEPINTRFSDINPVLSGDETKMVFISKLQFYDAAFYTQKVDGKWIFPRNIVPELGVDGDVYPTCLSYDGNEMFIYRNDDFTGNIYSTKLENGKWTPIVKLNDNINTKYWESHASISKDGKTLYFTSNRKDGYGGLDIYYSKKDATGDWGPAKNIGPVLNTKYNEETPFITSDDSRIFFSSYGHYNMGGYDIFMSLRINDTLWAKPVNLGYPINTTDDNFFFNPVGNGRFAYYSIYEDTGTGRNDIYRVIVYNADFPRKYNIKGQLDFSGESVQGSEVIISVIESQKNDTVAHVNPDNNGKFAFNVPQGRYDLIFESKRFEKIMQSLMVGPNTPYSGLTLANQIILKPLVKALSPDEINNLLEIEDSIIIVKNGSPLEIVYIAEKGSEVLITVYNICGLVSSGTVKIDKRRQTFTIEPKPGTNNVNFTLKDTRGHTVTKSVKIVYEVSDSSLIAGKTVSGVIRGPVKPVEKPSILNISVEILRQQLLKYADGIIKEVLLKLDMEKAGIKTNDDLINYLKKNDIKFGYSGTDIDTLLAINARNLAEIDKSTPPLIPREEVSSPVRKSVYYSILIMGILGFITFILIWIERKKKKGAGT